MNRLFSAVKKTIVFVIFAEALVLMPRSAFGTSVCADLASARSFSFLRTVRSGRVVSGEKALQAVLQQREPLGCLKRVAMTGTFEGQMYALTAIREINRREFEHLIKTLRRQHFKVATLATEERGVLEKSRGAAVLNDIERGEYEPIIHYYKTGSFRR